MTTLLRRLTLETSTAAADASVLIDLNQVDEQASLFDVFVDGVSSLKAPTTLGKATKQFEATVTSQLAQGFRLVGADEQVSLFFKADRSDKEYHAQLKEANDSGLFEVFFQYGPRGGTLKGSKKTAEPVDYFKAKKAYDKVVAEKTGKGYALSVESSGFSSSARQGEHSGVGLVLLNTVENGQLEALFVDDSWVAQEKFDGHRRAVSLDNGQLEGINRKGFISGLPQPVVDAFAGLAHVNDSLVDGELIGDRYVIFDVIKSQGESLQSHSVTSRNEKLRALVGDLLGTDAVSIAPIAYSEAEKRALFAQVKAAGGEGLVFKRKSATYEAGRPASGGDYLKFKFVHHATVQVIEPHATKRSVSFQLFESGHAVPVGNVTIPANASIPSAGDLIEVQYLYAFKNGSLFQPVFKGERTDVGVDACCVSQLVFKPEYSEVEEDEGLEVA